MNLSQVELYNIQDNPKKVYDVLNGLCLFATNAAIIKVSTKNVTNVPVPTGEVKLVVDLQLQASDVDLPFGEFTLAASVADTVANAGTTPAIDDTTPTLKNGKGKIVLTLPAGTYVANETITVTVANYTAPDGRTITGGNVVFTIVSA